MRTSLRIASAVAASAVLVVGLTACSSKAGSGSDAKGGSSAAASAGASAAAGATGASGGPGSAAAGGVTGLAPKEALLASAAVMDKAGRAKLTATGATADDGGTGVIVWKAPGAFEMTTKNEGKDYKVTLIGDVMYVGATEQLAALAGGKPWMKIDLKAAGKATGGAADTSSFATMAQMMNPAIQLLAAAPTATKVGAEKVGGADTVHYRSVVPVETLAAGMNLSADLKAKVIEQLKKGGSSTTVELWINAKGELVKLSGTQLGLGEGTSASTVVYSELGTAAEPKAPAADQVFDLAELLAKAGR